MCCQESGEREASVSLFCPKAKSGERKFRKVQFHLLYNIKSFVFNMNIKKAFFLHRKVNGKSSISSVK